jgi:type IV secretory pathway VirB6-like protein
MDVTEEFIDVEARIKTKKELQNRYIELLKRATTINEMLSIEREIGSLQTEIESVEGRMNYLKDKIKFSTLSVSYYQETTASFGFFSKVAEALESGWSGFLWFIIGLSYLWVFVLIAIAVIYLIVRRRRKRRKAVKKL